jgi:glycosyltransferase involved in cell wall biosynthesis
MLSWERLKGWDVLVEAFCRAFSPQDEVTLFLKVMPDPAMPLPRIEKTVRDFIRNHPRLEAIAVPRIKLSGTGLKRDEIPLLYRAADAFVLPSRGEEYGQALLEAMASGLPTIATGWSGHLEFMNERNAWLLGFEKVPVPSRDVEEHPDLRGHSWAEPSRGDLITCMREVFENRGLALERAMGAREEVAEKFSIERAANLVSDRLGVLAGGRKSGPATLPSDRKVRIVLEGAFSIMSSTALVNRELGRALMARDRVSLAARPITDNETFEGNARFIPLEEALNKRFRMPAQIHVWHQWPPSGAAPSAGKWVLFQGWEYGSLPRKIQSLFRSGPDEIWTYSTYCAREFEADGIPRELIQVIPLGVDPSRYQPDGEIPDRLKFLSTRKVVFLFVGGTVWRKGIDILLSAYCRAFTRQDDVALVIKEMGSDSFYQDFNLTGAVQRLARTPGAPEIILIDENLGDDEMPGLYRSCTCLVHPYRGEGFGLPVLEAMACGLPVIVTAGGACDDFARGKGIIPLPARRKEIALPLETVRPAWVLEPDKDALVRALRKVAENPLASVRRARDGSRSVRNDWTWEKTAVRVESRCTALADNFQA